MIICIKYLHNTVKVTCCEMFAIWCISNRMNKLSVLLSLCIIMNCLHGINIDRIQVKLTCKYLIIACRVKLSFPCLELVWLIQQRQTHSFVWCSIFSHIKCFNTIINTCSNYLGALCIEFNIDRCHLDGVGLCIARFVQGTMILCQVI